MGQVAWQEAVGAAVVEGVGDALEAQPVGDDDGDVEDGFSGEVGDGGAADVQDCGVHCAFVGEGGFEFGFDVREGGGPGWVGRGDGDFHSGRGFGEWIGVMLCVVSGEGDGW